MSWAASTEGGSREGGDFPSLLCLHETPPAVLCPSLGLPAQGGWGAVGAGPEEGQKGGALLLRKAEGNGFNIEKRRLQGALSETL